MAVKNNPQIGTIECEDCGGDASVHQNQVGKGRYLYTRCVKCKYDGRQNKRVQTRLWYETDWLDGKPEKCPPNVEALPDWQPIEPEKEPSGEPDGEPREPSRGGLFAVLTLMLGAGAFAVYTHKGRAQ